MDMQKLLDDIRIEMDTLKECIGRMEQRLDELQGKFADLNNLLQARPKVEPPAVVVDVTEEEETITSVVQEGKKGEERIGRPSGTMHVSEDVPSSFILGERIKPATDLRHAISLNDSFRFTRELFGGDAARMNRLFAELSSVGSFEAAMALFQREVQVDEDNETASAFVELLHKYFN